MNPETRNLISAICLSMAVLIGYQMLFGKVPENDQINKEVNTLKENNEPSIDLPKEEKQESFVEKDNKSFKKVPRVKINNDQLTGSLSLIGARIDDLTLINYRESLEPNSKQIRFLKKIDGNEPFFVQFGWSSPDNLDVPNGNTLWKTSKNSFQPNENLEINWTNEQGIKFYQNLSIDENFVIKVE